MADPTVTLIETLVQTFLRDVAGTVYTGSTVTHTFTQAGDQTVTLTVTDDDGTTDSISATVTVAPNEAPTADFDWSPTSPVAGDAVTFDGTLSSDPDGTVEAWDWTIDGTAYTGSTVTHTFSTSGTKTVSLTVTDNDGATATRTVDINVGDTTGFGAGGFGEGGFGDPTSTAGETSAPQPAMP